MTIRTEQHQEIIRNEWKNCSTDLEKIRVYLERNCQSGEENDEMELEKDKRQCFWNMYQNSEDHVHALYLKEEQRLKVKAEDHVELALKILKKDSNCCSLSLSTIQRFDKISSYDKYIQQSKKLLRDIDDLQDFLRMSHLSLSKILCEYETATGCDATNEAPSYFRDCKLCPRKNCLLWLKNQTVLMNEKLLQRKKDLMYFGKSNTSFNRSASIKFLKTSFRKTRPFLRRLCFKKKKRKKDSRYQ